MHLPKHWRITGSKVTFKRRCKRYDHIHSKCLSFSMSPFNPLNNGLKYICRQLGNNASGPSMSHSCPLTCPILFFISLSSACVAVAEARWRPSVKQEKIWCVMMFERVSTYWKIGFLYTQNTWLGQYSPCKRYIWRTTHCHVKCG